MAVMLYNIMIYLKNITNKEGECMFRKSYKCLIIIIFVSCLTIFKGCNHPTPKEQNDYKEIVLDEEVVSIKSGLPYATQRVSEWRDTMHLNYISAGFMGKEEIKERRGRITYLFYEENVTKKLDADAYVRINMNSKSIIRFSSSYGTPKELIGSAISIDVDNWQIDINEAFDIAIAELGEDSIDKYDNPKVVLRCGEKSWDFAVYPSQDAKYQDLLIRINPETGEVIEIWEN